MSEFDWDKLSNEIAKSTDPLPVLRADQESRWLYGDQPAAEDYIRQFPELSDDATLVLILAEMSLRSRLGETVVMADFQRRFPKFASDLPIQWAVLSAIDSGTPAVTTRQSDRLPVSSLLPPQESGEIGRVPGYRIFEQIGQGAMGVVFRAEDLVLKRIVAIKMMKPEIAESLEHRQRFLREAQAAARLDHPHIVPIFHVGDHCGVPFLVMPLLRGESLRRQMSRTGCSVTEAVETVRQVAEGLEAAHRQGMTHRDVKPDNIWRDESGVCKLLDFGLSRIPSEDALATQSGLILGTPAYMAPEQARGEHVGPRSDLFSLGVVLYELLTGRRPFAGRNAMEVLSNVITEQPASPDKINPAVPAALARLCMRLLGKNPDDRISSAAEVIDCLRKFQVHAPRQRTVSPGQVSSRWHWIVAGPSAALLASLAVYISVQGSGEPASPSDTPTGGTSGFPDTPGTAEQPALKITPVVVRPLAESATADTPGSATGGETELLRGIRFNGTSSFIHVPSFQFSGKLPLTMEAWIVPELMGDLTRHICLLGHPGGGIGINASRLFGGGLNDALGWTDGYASHPLESDCLYHVAVVFAAGKKTQVFVNGNWSGENNREALPNPVPVEPSLTIGKHMKDFREFYSGTLLELRLSDVERYQPSQSFRPKLVLETDPRTLLLFHLNELSGNEIIDSSGHGHHGILTDGQRVVVTRPE